MKSLKLYRIESGAFPVMHVAARSGDQAAQIYVTWAASVGRSTDTFSVEAVSMDAIGVEERAQLQGLLAVRTEGVASLDPSGGWSIESDAWSSFAAGEEVR